MQSPPPDTADNAKNPASGAVPTRRLLLLGAGPLPAPDAPHAPGVANRLAHFLLPALAAGHECLVFSLEEGAPPVGDRPPDPRETGGRPWQCLAAGIADFQRPEKLAALASAFKPKVVAAAGTLQAAATAALLAGDAPLWIDFFGDPLAEIQAKASLLGAAFDTNEQMHVWELMLRALLRGDAFSTVSRRQRDALLGQLLLLGMTDADAGGDLGIAGLIHSIPCGAASFDSPVAPFSAAEREARLAAHGIPSSARIALWSGGFNAWTDAPTLIAGLERAMENDPRLRLVATGGALPDYLATVYEEVERLAAASKFADRIHLLGWLSLEEAARWAAAADVGLVVDRPCAETRLGARNRLLAFAAARCPIVASRGTEAVEEMEAAQALAGFEAGSPGALAAAIVRLLEDPREAKAMAKHAASFCERMYRFETTARPFLEFVERAGDLQSADGDGPPTAAEMISALIDPELRRRERAELARYRSGRLSRLRRWMKGNAS